MTQIVVNLGDKAPEQVSKIQIDDIKKYIMSDDEGYIVGTANTKTELHKRMMHRAQYNEEIDIDYTIHPAGELVYFQHENGEWYVHNSQTTSQNYLARASTYRLNGTWIKGVVQR